MLSKSQIYQSVLDSCLISPIGVKIGEALLNSMDKSVACSTQVNASELKQIIRSIGATFRPEFSSMHDMDLLKYLGRGVFLYEGLISDVLGVCLAATEMMESGYLEEHQLVSEIRYMSIAFCGTQHVGTVDAMVLLPTSFSDIVWRRSLSWLSTYDKFEDEKLTSLLIKSVKLGLNINEGDFMIRPRFRGMKSGDLKTTLLRCATGIQSGLAPMLDLLNVVLVGLNRVIIRMDVGRSKSILDENEAFARLYYACCQLADSLSPRPDSYEYLLQRSQRGTWATFKRTGSPIWPGKATSYQSPLISGSNRNGFVDQITAHGQDTRLGWRYVRTIKQVN